MAGQSDPNDLFLQLLAEHESRIFGFLYALICHREDAEDVMQQVVVTMWQKFDGFQPGTDFAAWGCAIAKNRALNYFQKRNRRIEFSLPIIELLEATRAEQPSEVRIARRKALRGCLSKLPDADRRLIEASYQRGVQIKRLAEDIGRPAASVYTSLRRIRRALFHCINTTVSREARG